MSQKGNCERPACRRFLQRKWKTVLEGELEIQLQTYEQGARAREFVEKIERVQAVILIGEIEDAEGDLTFTMQKTIAGKCIHLPEITTRLSRIVSAVALIIPISLSLGKEAAGMVVNR